ncbi:DUF6325 family protein [Nocardioides sediminis]|uniref:DUF6325 family protein n=1 Tax=Nocardioides sediminis TaxID=433648 RepID=UPI000D31A652|nr:DUF6325 family protein [Nocardioides sediminis]
MTTGPVQVLVLGFGEPHFDGSALRELARLRDAGVVRLVDLLVVRRTADGSLETVDDLLEGHGAVAAALLGDADGSDPDETGETWSLADLVPERGVAVVALVEHLWAGPLATSLRQAGAALLEETWLSEADRARLTALEA